MNTLAIRLIRRHFAGRLRLTACLLPLLHSLVMTSPAWAVPGDEHWSDEFGYPGVGGQVHALHVHGPDLVVGGLFQVAGTAPASNIARWNGFNFSPLGTGLGGRVRAITTWNGDIIAAGLFTSAGGATVNNIARWDGNAWQPMGQGMTGSFARVNALAVHDGYLVAAGTFSSADGQPAANIARWDGTGWQPLGAGLTGTYVEIKALTVHEGSLIAGGVFQMAGGLPASRVAAWDGVAWQAMGSGTPAEALTVFEDELYAHGGDFGSPFARWDGAGWVTLNQVGPVRSFANFGGELVGGGGQYAYYPVDTCCFTSHLGRWTGSAWAQLDPGPMLPLAGINGMVNALAVYNGELIVGGGFDRVSETVPAANIARWNGSAILPLYPQAPSVGVDYPVAASVLMPNGFDMAIGGHFMRPGDILSLNVASWRGYSWGVIGGTDIGPARYDGGPPVAALVIHNGALIAGGGFYINGISSQNVAAWTGTWSGLGQGVEGPVEAMTVYNNELIVGGGVYSVGGTPVDGLGRWNGLTWQPLGHPIVGGSCYIEVSAMVVYRGELVIGGCFSSVGGVDAHNIARWDGAAWHPLGNGVNGPVKSLLVQGPKLYVGGEFSQAGGAPASRIALWNGGLQTWAPLGAGMTHPPGYTCSVEALASYNGDIMAGGRFATAGGVPAQNIARWNGTDWQPLGSGINGTVETLIGFLGLVAGGNFSEAGGKLAFNMARWDDDLVSGVEDRPPGPAPALILNEVSPNPSRGAVEFTYSLPKDTPVTLTIHDIQGRVLRVLFDREAGAGSGQAIWDGRDGQGRRVESGVYLARLEAAGRSEVRKFALVR